MSMDDIVRQKIRNEARFRNIKDISQFVAGAEYGYNIKESVDEKLVEAARTVKFKLNCVTQSLENAIDFQEVCDSFLKLEELILSTSNQENNEGEKKRLIDFLIWLNDKELINNHDFDYEKEVNKYLKLINPSKEK